MLDRPMFISRERCISCGSHVLREVAGGTFSDEPLRSFIDADPWGENPLPVLQDRRWSFVECRDCDQRYHRNVLSSEWNEIRFSKWMDGNAIREFEAQHGGRNMTVDHVQHCLRLRDLGVRRVLDFGCGFGQFLEMCHLFGFDAHGVDRSNARRSGAGVQIHAELEEAPGTFDAITMFEVLEHLDDPLGMLKALKARLKPGGIMIIEVPDTNGVNSIHDETSYRKIHPLDHINAFTPESLVKIMAKAGFSPIAKRPAYVTTSPKRLAKDALRPILKRRATTQRYFHAV